MTVKAKLFTLFLRTQTVKEMSQKNKLPIPVVQALRQLGRDINTARRRRRVTMALMAERAGMGRSTLSKIEKGDPSVSMGSYVSVIFVLGMTDRLKGLIDAGHDLVGRSMEEENLPKRICTTRKIGSPVRKP